MTHQQNRQIRGAVIRTVMMQFLAAHGAGIIDRQIPAEQGTAATLGTFAFPPL